MRVLLLPSVLPRDRLRHTKPQGHQAKDDIRIQAMVHPIPEPVLLAAKTAKVPCNSNTLGLSEYWGIKKTINKPSQMYLMELSPSPSPFPLSSSVTPMLAHTEHLTGFQVYCVSLCICVHRSDRASSFQVTKYVFGQLLSRSNRRANSKNMFL